MSASEIEITPYPEAPWAPRLDGAQFACRVMLHGSEVMTWSTRGDRDAVLKAAKKFVERMKKERKGQAESFRNFKIKA